jgi:hypothetical protein
VTPPVATVTPAPPAAPAEAGDEAAPSPRILSGRWVGFLTDEECRGRGAVDDHGQCFEACLRRGRKPLIMVDGTLYGLVGLERIRGRHDRAVIVQGEMDLDRHMLTVVAGRPLTDR